jgi:hypothetical protein
MGINVNRSARWVILATKISYQASNNNVGIIDPYAQITEVITACFGDITNDALSLADANIRKELF